VSSVLLGLISAHDDFSYDMLSWASELYVTLLLLRIRFPQTSAFVLAASTLLSESNTYSFSEIDSLPAQFVNFVQNLMGQLRGSSPLLRLGAVLCLQSCLTLCPLKLGQTFPNLYSLVVIGCADSHRLTRQVYINCLSILCGTDPAFSLTSSLQAHIENAAPFNITDPSHSSFNDVLRAFVASNPAPSTSLLLALLNSVTYAAPIQQIELLRLAKLFAFRVVRTPQNDSEIKFDLAAVLPSLSVSNWAKPSTASVAASSHSDAENDSYRLDSNMIQKLLQLLSLNEDRIRDEILSIFEAFSASFDSLSDHLLDGVDASIKSILSVVSAPDQIILLALSTLSSFPYSRLPVSKTDDLMQQLFLLCCNNDFRIRQAVYRCLISLHGSWRTSAQWMSALSMLILGCSDLNPAAARTAVHSVASFFQKCPSFLSSSSADLSPDEQQHWREVSVNTLTPLFSWFIEFAPELLDCENILHRTRALNAIANIIESNSDQIVLDSTDITHVSQLSSKFSAFASWFGQPSSATEKNDLDFLGVPSIRGLKLAFCQPIMARVVTKQIKQVELSQSGSSPHVLLLCILYSKFGWTFFDESGRTNSEEDAASVVFRLEPLLASTNPLHRLFACHHILHGLFVTDKVMPKPLCGVIKRMSAWLSSSSSRLKQESAMFLLSLLIPMKISFLNRWIIESYLETFLETLDSDSCPVPLRIALLNVLDCLLLARPNACRPWLETIRDIVRRLFSSKTHNGLLDAVARVYSLTCYHISSISSDKALEISSYLFHDLIPAGIAVPAILANKSSSESTPDSESEYAPEQASKVIASDPLLRHLSNAQLRFLSLITLRALSSISSSEQIATAVLTSMLPLFRHSSADFRREALICFSQHLPHMAQVTESHSNLPIQPITFSGIIAKPNSPDIALASCWLALPLIGDYDLSARSVFHSSPIIQTLPNLNSVLYRMSLIQPDSEPASDSLPAVLVPLENCPFPTNQNSEKKESLTLNWLSNLKSVSVNYDLLKFQYGVLPVHRVQPALSAQLTDLFVLDTSIKAQATISQSLMHAISIVVDSRLRIFPLPCFEMIFYHLNESLQNHDLCPFVVMVLAQLCRLIYGQQGSRDAVSSVTSAILMQMHRRTSNSSVDILNACSLALKTIATLEPGLALSSVIQHSLSLPFWIDGDLRALKQIIDDAFRARAEYLRASESTVSVRAEVLVISSENGRQILGKLLNILRPDFSAHSRSGSRVSNVPSALGNVRPGSRSANSRSSSRPGTAVVRDESIKFTEFESSSPSSIERTIALEIVALILSASTDHLLINQTIDSMLEHCSNSEDSAFHDQVRQLFSEMITNFDDSHAVIVKMTGKWKKCIVSDQTKDRLFAIVILSFLSKRIAIDEKYRCVCRLLADPVFVVRRGIMRLILEGRWDSQLTQKIKPSIHQQLHLHRSSLNIRSLSDRDLQLISEYLIYSAHDTMNSGSIGKVAKLHAAATFSLPQLAASAVPNSDPLSRQHLLSELWTFNSDLQHLDLDLPLIGVPSSSDEFFFKSSSAPKPIANQSNALQPANTVVNSGGKKVEQYALSELMKQFFAKLSRCLPTSASTTVLIAKHQATYFQLASVQSQRSAMLCSAYLPAESICSIRSILSSAGMVASDGQRDEFLFCSDVFKSALASFVDNQASSIQVRALLCSADLYRQRRLISAVNLSKVNKSSSSAASTLPATASASWPALVRETPTADLEVVMADLEAERVVRTGVAFLVEATLSDAASDSSKLWNELLLSIRGVDVTLYNEDQFDSWFPPSVADFHQQTALRLSHLNLFFNILHALRDTSNPNTQAMFQELQNMASTFKVTARNLRTRIANLTHKASFLALENSSIAVTSSADFNSLCDRHAALELFSVDTSARNHGKAEFDKMTKTLEQMHAILDSLVRIEWRIVEGIGYLLFRSFTEPAQVQSGSRWLLSFVDDIHRGIRAAVRDALVRVSLCHVQHESDSSAAANSPLRMWLSELCIALQQRLSDSGAGLRRQRTDLVRFYCSRWFSVNIYHFFVAVPDCLFGIADPLRHRSGHSFVVCTKLHCYVGRRR
jgi:hypothetical protein